MPVFAADFSGRVVRVIDGDTIEVLHSGMAEWIRLHGVDCPERAQPYSRQAREFTSQLAFGQTVTVNVKDTGRHGGTVGEVLFRDGSSLNRQLVQAGLAWWYTKYAPGDHELKD